MAKKNTTTEGVVATEASVKTKAPKKRKSVQYDNWGYFFIALFFTTLPQGAHNLLNTIKSKKQSCLIMQFLLLS